MISYNFIVAILGVFAGLYALPYGNWEFSQKNILSGIVIYIVGVSGVFLSVFQYFAIS